MNQLLIGFAWCWLQVMVVAAVAIGLSALAMRRSPAASAAISWAGVLATLAAIFLAQVPLPKWASAMSPSRDTAGFRDVGSRVGDSTVVGKSADGSHAAITMDIDLLRGIAASVQRSQAAVTSRKEIGRIVVGALVLGTLLSVARLVYGLWTIANLRKTSRAITDDRLAGLVGDLRLVLGLRSLPPMRESNALPSAAVVGYWRPSVLLPMDWRQWSASELRAVVAHELAHIARRDLLVRLVAAIVVALHFAQPLVYWLRQRLLMAQEMAADELAASAVGSRTAYLHALSRLALRQDARPTDGPVAVLLPVFSGFLLRRIEMLRAKDGPAPRGQRVVMQWTAIAILLTAAASTATLRGLADPPGSLDEPPDRVARANDPKLKLPAAAAVFQRPGFDLATTSFGDGGALVIRLGEILQRSDVAARAFDEWFNGAWKQAFPTSDPPIWSFGDVEFIAGTPVLTWGKRLDEPDKDGQQHQFMFGANWVMFRWRKPVDELFEAFAKAPGVEKKSHQGKEYFCLPVIPMFGPVPTCVCKLDDHTLLTGVDGVGICKQLDKLAAKKTLPAWNAAWKQIDGGLVALVTTANQVNRPFQDEVEAEKALTNLFNRQLAMGVDWPHGSDSPPIIRVHIRCESMDDASQLRTEMQELAALASRLIDKNSVADEDDEAEIRLAKSLLEELKRVPPEIRQTEAGWQLRAEFTCPWQYLQDLQGL